ncbi:MAG: penicillin acylase family protein [Chthonomonadaceae bacterium]|nr:penicillin acylase family protein [Chthonomonadaceae bacterium]
MWFVALALFLHQPSYTVTRDDYGVPHVRASTWEQAFEGAGYATAEDRLWQMENSRRLARGTLAEVFGPEVAASDREVLRTGYTAAQIEAQLAGLDARSRAAFEAYALGVNAYIEKARQSKTLPPGYAAAGFQPQPWTALDSAAIAIRLGQLFGSGGAGELRNLALVEYLKGRPVKDRLPDVLDDLLWQNDPRSIPTVAPSDDPLSTHPAFPTATRAETEHHLAALPKVSLLELLPAIRTASLEDSRIVAETRNVPFKTGSYAVVVSKGRSRLGVPLLLSAPQMGFRVPSVVHEMSLDAEGVHVVGMDVPGVPGVIIGHTQDLAWGLTSGVADTDDIFFAPIEGGSYRVDGKLKPIRSENRALAVKGEKPESVVAKSTEDGPVLLATRSTVFVRRSGFADRELQGFAALYDLYSAKEPSDVKAVAARIPLTFNLFYATTSGHIGYHYCGRVPLRAPGWDPRFPMPLSQDTAWRGFVPPGQMPLVVDPREGLIANWNNKPAAWWPNFDTPAWGRIFRNSALLHQLTAESLAPVDLEMAAWWIARTEETAEYLMPAFRHALQGAAWSSETERQAAQMLIAYEGKAVAGSHGASLYLRTLDAVRAELFSAPMGSFLSPDLFRTALQPSLILNALEGETNIDYLAGRTADQLIVAAFRKAVERMVSERGENPGTWAYTPGTIPVVEGVPIPYSNRGTYIQLVELWKTPAGRNVLTPGVAESGAHASDQEPLARAWMYKRMRWAP